MKNKKPEGFRGFGMTPEEIGFNAGIKEYEAYHNEAKAAWKQELIKRLLEHAVGHASLDPSSPCQILRLDEVIKVVEGL